MEMSGQVSNLGSALSCHFYGTLENSSSLSASASLTTKTGRALLLCSPL